MRGEIELSKRMMTTISRFGQDRKDDRASPSVRAQGDGHRSMMRKESRERIIGVGGWIGIVLLCPVFLPFRGHLRRSSLLIRKAGALALIMRNQKRAMDRQSGDIKTSDRIERTTRHSDRSSASAGQKKRRPGSDKRLRKAKIALVERTTLALVIRYQRGSS